MSIARFARNLRRPFTDDTGVALATVLVFMFAGVLLSLVVASTVMFSYTFSSSTRASVQSQASAEAGIAAARAGLLTGECAANDGLFENDDPYFRVQVYRPDAAGGWTEGCPSIAQNARIESHGFASGKGTGGDTTGDQTTIEAILGNSPGDSALSASGPAIFAYSASGFSGSGSIASTRPGEIPDVMLRTGDVNCVGGADGAAQLVVKSGNFTGSGSCNITGDLWVNGDVTLNGGARVQGSVTARNVTVAAHGVGKNVWADETFTGRWSTPVGGWVSAKSVEIAGATIAGNVWARDAAGTMLVSGAGVNGTIYASGSLRVTGGTVKSGQVAGLFCRTGGTVQGPLTVHGYASGCSAVPNVSKGTPVLAASPSKPSAIVVPEWIDFGSKAEHFTVEYWGGTALATMSGSNCSNTQFQAALNTIGTNKGLIDARGCSNGIDLGGSTAFSVKDDLTIIANKITTGGSISLNAPVPATPDDRAKLWIITPDIVANGTPDCPAGTYNNEWSTSGRTIFLNGTTAFNNFDTMIYSPCVLVQSSSITINGQMFVGGAALSGAATLNFRPVGMPGYNLDTGEESTPAATEWDRQIVSQRNITG